LLDFMDRHPRVGAVGCRLLNTDGSLQRWTGGAFPNLANVACHYLFLDRLLPAGWRPRPLFLDRDAQEDLDVGWVSGACMMLRREAVGARIFDPRFFLYGEDLELCYRLRRSGWGVVYTPTASIVHHQGASMKQQAGEIMLSSLKGPRYFLLQTRSRAEVMFIDLLTLMGFGLRGILYGIAAVLRPGRGYAAKAESSLHYLGVAFRVMRT
jgi:GT2 family glycosyltransferase